ncbi:MAG: LysM peptidoglycan-binding domain-containing protein [Lentisphaeria bacterium]
MQCKKSVFIIFSFLFCVSASYAQYRVTTPQITPVNQPSSTPKTTYVQQPLGTPQNDDNAQHQIANMRADFRVLQEEMQKMIYQMSEMEKRCQNLEKKNIELQTMIAAQDDQNMKREKNWNQKWATLQEALTQEIKDRQASIAKMSNNVVGLLKDEQKKNSGPSRPVAYTGKYVELKIEPGDTLGHIAASAGISVKQLKEINNLKNDIIIVGQVLKVPMP